MSEQRVLITGSRDWPDAWAVRRAIKEATDGFRSQDVTVVHGDCPTGADAQADAVAVNWGFRVERHPADWSQGRKAGPERNAAMVALGADLCLAFIGPCTSPRCRRADPHESHGATGCADLAEQAGIETHRIRAALLCDGCACKADHDGDFGSAGHPGPCPPHTCNAATP